MSFNVETYMLPYRKLTCPASEAELTSHWQYTDRIYISVLLTTYNHYAYVREALNGILAQTSLFRFEVIAHDDASTDQTAAVIQDYANRFPNVIKPILQSCNQFQQGKHVVAIAYLHARGDYITICEGDDYWIDPFKLTKQLAALKNNPGARFCFSAAWKTDTKTSTTQPYAQYYSSPRVVPLQEIIDGMGEYVPTATIFIDRTILEDIPWWVLIAFYPDWYMQIYGATFGGAIYLPDITAVYRENVPSSMSANIPNYSAEYWFRVFKQNCLSLNAIAKEYPGTRIINALTTLARNVHWCLLRLPDAPENTKILLKSVPKSTIPLVTILIIKNKGLYLRDKLKS